MSLYDGTTKGTLLEDDQGGSIGTVAFRPFKHWLYPAFESAIGRYLIDTVSALPTSSACLCLVLVPSSQCAAQCAVSPSGVPLCRATIRQCWCSPLDMPQTGSTQTPRRSSSD